MTAPGSLTARLVVHDNDTVAQASMAYRPIANPEALLRTRTSAQAISLVSNLFTGCRWAHRLAAQRALSAELSPLEEWRLECAIAAEGCREAFLHVGHQWPDLAGFPPWNRDSLREVVLLVERTGGAEYGPFLGDVEAIRETVAEQLLLPAASLHSTLDASRPPDDGWLRDAHRVLATIKLSAFPLAESGQTVDEPYAVLVKQLARGFAFLNRLLAILQRGPVEQVAPATGSACVDTCRGELTHSAELDADDRVLHYRISAPTNRQFSRLDWMRPGLDSLQGMPQQEAKRILGIWLAALDPCGGSVIEKAYAGA